MKRPADLIVKYANNILSNKRDALISVSVFAILPFTTWLAVALVALVTLRKGKEAGLNILLPAMVAYLLSLITIIPLGTALINVFITFLPAYAAAGMLRVKANWSSVFGAFGLQVFLGIILLQYFAPEAVVTQYQHFQSLLSEMPISEQLLGIQKYLASWDQLQLAHIFFGIQVLVIVGSATISLLFARFIQSKLFIPGGFKKEMSGFRSGKIALLALTLLGTASYFKVLVAMDLLPLMLFYFLLSGLNLSFAIFAQKKIIAIILFIVSLVISPLTLLMTASFFGILDSLFDFRTYFFATAKKSI